MAIVGAVTIEPFEVSRWGGGCGPVYGISMGMCLDGRFFWGRVEEDRGMAIELRDEE
jgi:hypothetical protein